MKAIVRFRFVILGVIAVGLIVATVVTQRSHNASRTAGHLGPTPGPSTAGHVAAKGEGRLRLWHGDQAEPGHRFVREPGASNGSDALQHLPSGDHR